MVTGKIIMRYRVPVEVFVDHDPGFFAHGLPE
jgi:hypothetical protein